MLRNALIPILLALVATTTSAQDQASEPVRFFQSPRLALLFHAGGLDLDSYESGVGIGFRHSDEIYWRLSLGVTATKSTSERGSPAWQWNSTETSASLNALAAPLLLLYQQDPGFVVISPCIGAGYRWTNQEDTNIDSVGSHTNSRSDDRLTFTVGGSLGVGFSFWNRLVLSGEYRAYFTFQRFTGDRSVSDQAESELSVYSSSGKTLLFGTAAILTLYYSL